MRGAIKRNTGLLWRDPYRSSGFASCFLEKCQLHSIILIRTSLATEIKVTMTDALWRDVLTLLTDTVLSTAEIPGRAHG